MTKENPSTPNNSQKQAFAEVEGVKASEEDTQSIASPQVEKSELEKDASKPKFSPLIEIALQELQS